MTIDEFIAKLEATPRDWWVGADGVIRRGSNCRQCPITSLFPEGKYLVGDAFTLGAKLEMDYDDVRGIIDAADMEINHSKKLRARILKACGLDK